MSDEWRGKGNAVDHMSCLSWKNEIKAAKRYGHTSFSAILPEMQTGKSD